MASHAGGRSRRPGRIAAIAGVTALLVGAVGPSARGDAADDGSYATRLNQERVAHGLPPLTVSPDLAAVAQAWAEHMAATGVLAHNPALASQVDNWQAVGENVGDGPSISDLDAAFFASTPHRENILDPDYNEIGLGSVRRDGTIWISVVFRDPLYDDAPPPPHASRSATRSAVIRTAGRAPAAVPAPPYAMRGTAGRFVMRIQHLVHVDADGVFGPVTERAVRRFQRHHRLKADGIVGPLTAAALRRQAARDAADRAMSRPVSSLQAMSPGCTLRVSEA